MERVFSPGVALVGVVNPRAMASTLSICFAFAASNGKLAR